MKQRGQLNTPFAGGEFLWAIREVCWKNNDWAVIRSLVCEILAIRSDELFFSFFFFFLCRGPWPQEYTYMHPLRPRSCHMRDKNFYFYFFKISLSSAYNQAPWVFVVLTFCGSVYLCHIRTILVYTWGLFILEEDEKSLEPEPELVSCAVRVSTFFFFLRLPLDCWCWPLPNCIPFLIFGLGSASPVSSPRLEGVVLVRCFQPGAPTPGWRTSKPESWVATPFD